jgi:hypothetical protein
MAISSWLPFKVILLGRPPDSQHAATSSQRITLPSEAHLSSHIIGVYESTIFRNGRKSRG